MSEDYEDDDDCTCFNPFDPQDEHGVDLRFGDILGQLIHMGGSVLAAIGEGMMGVADQLHLAAVASRQDAIDEAEQRTYDTRFDDIARRLR